jgi:hypothetical protein
MSQQVGGDPCRRIQRSLLFGSLFLLLIGLMTLSLAFNTKGIETIASVVLFHFTVRAIASGAAFGSALVVLVFFFSLPRIRDKLAQQTTQPSKPVQQPDRA